MLRYIAVIILFGLTIPLTGHTDRLIKDLITVFGDGSGSDVVLEADVGSGANNPRLKYDNTENAWQFTNDGIDFLEFGSGSGGGSAGISLVEDRSFEKGVAGSGYSADLTSEEIVVLLSPTNTKSLKVVATDTPLAGKFSTYTYNASINSEWHEGMPITVKGWIKWPSTNASIGSVTVSDTIDELQSITLESKDEWQEFKVKTHVGATSTIRTVIKFGLEDGQVGDLFYLDMLDVIAGHEGSSPYKVANIGDWEEYTPSFNSGFSSGSGGNQSESWRWKRVGSDMIIEGGFRLGTTGASMGTGAFEFSIPSGYKIDHSKLEMLDGYPKVGTVRMGDYSASQGFGEGQVVIYNNSLTNFIIATNNTSFASISATSPFTWTQDDFLKVEATVPIQGWSSSTSTVVTQTQEETVKTANVLSADVASDGTVSNENHDFINGNCSVTSGVFNCPFISGVFTVAPKVTGCVATNAAGTAVAVCEKGVLSKDNAQIITEAGSSRANLAYTIEFTKNAPDYNKTQVISGSFEAIKSDNLTKVEANKDGASQSIPHASGTVLTFPNEIKDTTNSFNNATGVFTAKNSATFNFDLMAWFDFASWNQGHIAYARAVHKRDAVVQKYYWMAFHIVPFTSASVEVQLDGDVSIDMLEGDTVEIELFQSSGASKTTKTGDGQNELVITEEPDTQSIVENLSDNTRLKKDQYSTTEMKWGKWNGEQLYRRCFTVDSDKTTTNTLLYTIDANLVPRNVPRYYNSPSSYALLSASYSSDSFLINYNPSNGEIRSYVSGNYIVKTGTSFCMDYTK